jgi:hypothetical protein
MDWLEQRIGGRSDKAVKFYTEVLGFVKGGYPGRGIPADRTLPDSPEGIELVLELMGFRRPGPIKSAV